MGIAFGILAWTILEAIGELALVRRFFRQNSN